MEGSVLATPSFFPPSGDNHTKFTGDSKDLALVDTVNGLAQKNARMWQIIALVSLSAFFISLGICAYAVTLPKTVPVIVTVNSEGRASYVGKIDRAIYTSSNIPEVSKLYTIKSLLSFMHTWVIDQAAQQQYISQAQALVQAGAISQLDRFFRANNPYQFIGEVTKSIDIESPLKQTENTYIVYFTATEKFRGGLVKSITRYSALINLEVFEVSEKNPLGLYIVNFDIKQVARTEENQ
jgi:type IV secretory pathway TrbF-like protein